MPSNRYVTPYNPIIKNAVYGLTTNPAANSRAPVLSSAQDNTVDAARQRLNAFKQRSSDIGSDGSRANDYLKQSLNKRAQLAARQQRQFNPQFPDAGSAYSQVQQNATGGFDQSALQNRGAVDQYLAGLRKTESSNNYKAKSPISTASGAYQYINSTWGGYGGYATARQAPSHIQDQRARQDALRSFDKYGNWEQVAASHFYPAWAGDRNKWGNTPAPGNPTVAGYVRKVISNMGIAASSGNPAQIQAALPMGGDVSNIRQQVVKTAMGYLGTPYVWGGKTPKGFDCSGLTSYVYKQFGINLPAWSNHQTSFGQKAGIQYARPGDLVGWNKGGHVAIYIGNGKILHSPRPGQKVQIRNLFKGEAVYAVRLTMLG